MSTQRDLKRRVVFELTGYAVAVFVAALIGFGFGYAFGATSNSNVCHRAVEIINQSGSFEPGSKLAEEYLVVRERCLR